MPVFYVNTYVLVAVGVLSVPVTRNRWRTRS